MHKWSSAHLGAVALEEVGSERHLTDGDVSTEALADDAVREVANRGQWGEDQFACPS